MPGVNRVIAFLALPLEVYLKVELDIAKAEELRVLWILDWTKIRAVYL